MMVSDRHDRTTSPAYLHAPSLSNSKKLRTALSGNILLEGRSLNQSSISAQFYVSDFLRGLLIEDFNNVPIRHPTQEAILRWSYKGGPLRYDYLKHVAKGDESLTDDELQASPERRSTYNDVFIKKETNPATVDRILSTVSSLHREDATNSMKHIIKKTKLDELGTTVEQWRMLLNRNLTQDALEHERRYLKHLLREHDRSFIMRFGFAPTREHKELIRPLYSFYKEIRETSNTLVSKNQTEGVFINDNDDNARGSFASVLANKESTEMTSSQQVRSNHGGSKSLSSIRREQLSGWRADVPMAVLITPISDLTEYVDLVEWRKVLKAELNAYRREYEKQFNRSIQYNMDIEPILPIFTRFKKVQKELFKRKANPMDSD